MEKKYKKAVVLLSGGQDSTTCLGVAMQEASEVVCIGFNYGQRHKVELECAQKIADKFKLPFTVVDIKQTMQDLGTTSSLIGSQGDVSAAHPDNEELPASFVPARNALFLTLAHGFAQAQKADTIYIGACETDYSGYPDCRDSFIARMQAALNAGYKTDILIKTPLMWLTKADTFKLALDVGVLNVVSNLSHTCYEGDHTTCNEWGYGCGKCPACILRKKGYEEFATKLEGGGYNE